MVTLKMLFLSSANTRTSDPGQRETPASKLIGGADSIRTNTRSRSLGIHPASQRTAVPLYTGGDKFLSWSSHANDLIRTRRTGGNPHSGRRSSRQSHGIRRHAHHREGYLGTSR